MSQPMNEPEAGQPVIDSLHRFGTPLRFEFQKSRESLEIKDIHQRTVLNVRSCDSTFCTHKELVDANDVVLAKLKKNLPTLHAGWTAYSSNGEKLFRMHNTRIFPKRTSISVSKVKVVLPLSLDTAFALKGVGLAAEDTDMGDMDIALALRGPSLGVHLALTDELGGSLSAESVRAAAAYMGTASEKAAWEKESQEKGSEHLNFQFKGSWTSKECAMYVNGSETKIAQMHKLDDNDTEGFLVEVIPNINWKFVIACFAVVEAMKSEAQKQKEFLGHVVGISAKFLGGVVIGAGKCCFECVCV